MTCIDANTGKKHIIRWYWVHPVTGWKTRANAGIRVAGFGWDAACTCGYETRTGGATRGYVERMVREHKWDAWHGFLDENGHPNYKNGADSI